MPELLDQRLIYVTGKGGVGRSTVCGALGLAVADRGRQVIVCEISEQDRLSRAFGNRRREVGQEAKLSDGLWGSTLDPQAALRDWLSGQLGSRTLSRPLVESNAFNYFAAAAPGAREFATMVKVWELVQGKRRNSGPNYDTVIVDGPASGHGIGLLRTPHTFSEIARVGPLGKQGERVHELLGDPDCTAHVAVALAEEMPVNETLDLQRAVPDAIGQGLAAIVVNGLYPERFSDSEAEQVETATAQVDDGVPRRALAAAQAEHRWVHGQREQLERLREEADAPVVSLPFLFEPELGVPELQQLAEELKAGLGGDGS